VSHDLPALEAYREAESVAQWLPGCDAGLRSAALVTGERGSPSSSSGSIRATSGFGRELLQMTYSRICDDLAGHMQQSIGPGNLANDQYAVVELYCFQYEGRLDEAKTAVATSQRFH
jgi:hypothetical protein